MENSPRPSELTQGMRLAAAKLVVAKLVNGGLISLPESTDAERDLADLRLGPWTDGYTIAKKLDDCCGWDCNLPMAEILDGFSSELCAQLLTAQKEWASRENIQPPIPLGQHVRLRSGETGVLDEVYKYGPAQYCVRIDGDEKAAPPTNSRRIINFEDAVAD